MMMTVNVIRIINDQTETKDIQIHQLLKWYENNWKKW